MRSVSAMVASVYGSLAAAARTAKKCGPYSCKHLEVKEGGSKECQQSPLAFPTVTQESSAQIQIRALGQPLKPYLLRCLHLCAQLLHHFGVLHHMQQQRHG